VDAKRKPVCEGIQSSFRCEARLINRNLSQLPKLLLIFCSFIKNKPFYCENFANYIDMLIEFSVGNFLSFREPQTLSMVASSIKDKGIDENDNVFSVPGIKNKFLKSAVIYGANASGKSNFIEAFSFFKAFILNSSKETQANQAIEVERYKLSTETEEAPSFFEIIFNYKDIQYRYGFEVDNQKINSEWFYHKPKTKEIEYFYRKEQEFDLHEKFSVGKTLCDNKMVRNNALLLSVAAQFNDFIPMEVISWLYNFNSISGLKDESYQEYTLNLLQQENYKERILNFTKVADLGIDDLKLIQQEITDVNFNKNHTQEQKDVLLKALKAKKISNLMSFHQKYDKSMQPVDLVPFYFQESESAGTIKYFSLAGPLLDTLDNGKVLMIDELDSKLHPLLTEKIISLFNSHITNPKNAQLIFTTHDTNLLSAKLFRRDQVWFTEKDRYGASNVFSLVKYKVRNDASFEKDYLLGKYGGIPILKDFSKLFKGQTK
jgi:AAA15 family ATPase/GTPase